MTAFIEPEWIKLLFMLSDMEASLREMEKDLFYKLPLPAKKKLFRKTYCISASALAHIIEKHYHKIPRHMGAAKFTVSLPDILEWIRQAGQQEPVPISGTFSFFRELDTNVDLGFDCTGNNTSVITVITDAAGSIKTAFPGRYIKEAALTHTPVSEKNLPVKNKNYPEA